MKMFVSGPYPEIRDELRNSNQMLRKKKTILTYICACIHTYKYTYLINS